MKEISIEDPELVSNPLDAFELADEFEKFVETLVVVIWGWKFDK